MAWENPKTNWGQPGQTVPGVDDFNRIEGNIDILGKYDRAPGYGTATGTNTKAITLSPAPNNYYEGLCFAFKNSTQNTGAVTINVNGLGAKAIKKPNGNDLVSGNLKAGSVYTVRYNGTNFILQGSDSAGDAMPEHVLAGKTFSNDIDTDITGTMPVNPSQDAILNITGASKPTKIVPAGFSPGGTITAQVDSGQASHIEEGYNLGGCIGTAKTCKYAKGITASDAATERLTVTGLTFEPNLIIVEYYDNSGDATRSVYSTISGIDSPALNNLTYTTDPANAFSGAAWNVTSTSFSVALNNCYQSSKNVNWIALLI